MINRVFRIFLILFFILIAILVAATVYLRGCDGCGGPPRMDLSSGYETKRDAYAFGNSGDENGENTWGVWKLIYGGDANSRSALVTLQGTDAKAPFGGGVCFGLAASSVTFFAGWNSPGDFPQSPSAESPHDLESGGFGDDFDRATPVLRDFVERYQQAQYLPEVRATSARGARASYEAIRASLEAKDRNLFLVDIFTDSENFGPGGHTMAAVGVSDPGDDGWATIWVWDPNYPNRLRPLKVNVRSWEWKYARSPIETWTSAKGHGDCNALTAEAVYKALQRTPGGAAVQPAAVPDDAAAAGPGGTLPPMAVVSGGDVVFSSADGRFGLVDGRLVGHLRGVEYLYPEQPRGLRAVDRFVVPGDVAVNCSVTARSGAPYTYSLLTPTGSVTASGRPGRGARDALVVGAGAGSIQLRPRRTSKDVSLGLSLFTPGQTRTLTVRPGVMRSGDAMRIATTASDQTFAITNRGATRSYVLELASRTSGSQKKEIVGYRSEPITIGRGETQTVEALDWTHLRDSEIKLTRDVKGGQAPVPPVVAREGPGGGRLRWLLIAGGVVLAGVIAVGLFFAIRRLRAGRE